MISKFRGSLIFVLFCVTRYGWGWDKFIAEANCGSKGINMPRILKPYVSYVLPVIIAAVFVMSII